MEAHLPSEVGGVQEALGLGLGLEPQVGQAQRLQRHGTVPNEHRRGAEAQEAGLGRFLKALLLRGMKCPVLVSLALSRFSGRQPWEAAQIRQQRTRGRARSARNSQQSGF